MKQMPHNQASSRKRSHILVELLSVFILLPALFYFLPPFPILPALWVLAFWCMSVLIRDPGFDRSSLWRPAAMRSGVKPMLARFAINSVVLGTAVVLLAPETLFNLVKNAPLVWLLVIVLYPILSVYPQELIYRCFFFHRYGSLFPDKRLMIAINALLFGYMHIIFHNVVAVVLTVIGGALFALTYTQSRSTLLVAMEHSLYGVLIFTIGLGQFFYLGTIWTISTGIRL